MVFIFLLKVFIAINLFVLISKRYLFPEYLFKCKQILIKVQHRQYVAKMLEIKLIKLDNILTTNDNINQFDTSFDTSSSWKTWGYDIVSPLYLIQPRALLLRKEPSPFYILTNFIYSVMSNWCLTLHEQYFRHIMARTSYRRR